MGIRGLLFSVETCPRSTLFGERGSRTRCTDHGRHRHCTPSQGTAVARTSLNTTTTLASSIEQAQPCGGQSLLWSSIQIAACSR